MNNSHSDWRRTGGLYAVDDVKESPAKDNEWFTQYVIAQGKRIIVKINGNVTIDYTEPEDVSQNGHPNMPAENYPTALSPCKVMIPTA